MEAVRTRIGKALKLAAAAIAPELIADPVKVSRNKRRPLNANGVRVAINILTDGLVADDTVSSDATRVIEPFNILGSVRSPDDETAQDEIDDLYAATVKAVMADPTLGDLVIDVRQVALQTEFSNDEGAEPIGQFDLTLEIDYETAQGDPYTSV